MYFTMKLELLQSLYPLINQGLLFTQDLPFLGFTQVLNNSRKKKNIQAYYSVPLSKRSDKWSVFYCFEEIKLL